MRLITVTVGPLVAAVTNGICTSQQPLAAGLLTLNGSLVTDGVAIMDVPRRVIVTTGGSEAGKTVTVVGTTFGDLPAYDILALPGSATFVASVIDFKTVTSMTISAAAGAALTAGTNGTAGSQWVPLDAYASPNVALQYTVSGTVNYTVQQTLSEPSDSILAYQMTWFSSSDTNVVAATTSQQSNYLFAPRMTRVFLNSQTNPGYVRARILQAG